MRCPRCSTETSSRFCPNCGAELMEQLPIVVCPRCQVPHNLSACPNCGYPSPLFKVYRPMDYRWYTGLLSLIWDVSMILMVVLLAINLAVLIHASYGYILPELTAGSLERWPIYTIVPYLAALFFISGPVPTTLYFILILAALLFAYVHLAMADGKGLIRLLSSPLSSLVPRLRARNRWTMVAQLFLATTYFQLAYIFILNAVGVPTPAPASEVPGLWFDLFGLANASVYEEIASRVALIGLPMFIGSITFRWARTRGVSSTAHDSSKRRRYLLGSFRYLIGGNVDRKSPSNVLIPVFILLLFSSIMFGFAHVGGWGDWKAFPAFVAGLALGYAFLRGGLLAAVMLHFATDYMAATILVIGEDFAMQIFFSLFLIILVVFGMGFFHYYIIYSINLASELLFKKPLLTTPTRPRLYDTGRGETQAAPPPFLPPQSSSRGDLFATACANCGSPEAIYADGRLRCARCGKER